MHPLLVDRRSLFAYLLFWLAASLVPGAVLSSEAAPGVWPVAVASTVGFGILTLPTWYLSRALAQSGRPLRALLGHMLAGALWTLTYRVLWEILCQALSNFPRYRRLPEVASKLDLSIVAVGALFYVLVATFHHTLAEVERRQIALERQAALALSAERAELALLRAQVHPHFLFNVLNTISSLTSYNPELARAACLSLGDYLRRTLSAQDRPLVSLQDEWALCESYLQIEALRLGERLKIEASLPTETLDLVIPSLLLQPLVENAITHGIARDERPEPLLVTARAEAGQLHLTLKNSFCAEARRRSLGRGLANVRARMEAHYGEGAELRVSQTNRHFEVELVVPHARMHEERS